MSAKAKPRIVVAVKFHAATLKHELEPFARVTYAGDKPAKLARALKDADALLTPVYVPVNEALLSKAPKLRAVGNFGVGYNNIDLEACRRRKIAVINTPDVVTRPTAEIALALLLAAAKRVPEGEALCRTGSMASWTPWSFLGLELKNRRAVLVGRGRIGKETEKLFKGIGLKTSWITRQDSKAQILKKLAGAQVLSLHVPLNAQTRHWLNAEKLRALPKDAIVINTTRGPVVDEKALIAALKRRQIFAAGLDVYENEPLIPKALTQLKNTVLLPHVGTSTEKARIEMTRLAIAGVLGILNGKKPRNRVT